jgi:hypothetical protein
MTEQEMMQHEAIKKLLKAAVDRCTTLTYWQKEIRKQQIDDAATGADIIVDTAHELGIDLNAIAHKLFGMQ